MASQATARNGAPAVQPADEPETKRLIAGVLRRAPLIVGCTLLTAGAALAFSLHQTKQYTADASLLFRDPGFGQQLFGTSSNWQDPAREQATNISLVSLNAVADRTASSLEGGITGGEVSSKVNIEGRGQSDVASIKATDPNPQFAARLANAFAQNYIVFRRDADRRKVQQARALVTADFTRLSPAAQQASQGQSLQRQISRLSTLEALQTGNAELVQHATVPTVPSSPKTVRNTILGLAFGLLLGIGLALLLERLDRRLHGPKEFEEAFGLPVLTHVTEIKSVARSMNGMDKLMSSEGAAFDMLRARLRYFNVDHDIRSVLVTSAVAGEGKTTIGWSLAVSAAGAGLRTVLIEADFRRPTIARDSQVRSKPGLSELLSGQSLVEEALQRVPVAERRNGNVSTAKLDVIVAGSQPPNPVELLESERMAELIGRMKAGHDLIVIDSPPLPLVADTMPLVKMVDGVILVGQINRTTRDQAQALRAQLESLDAPMLGTVANRMPRRARAYGYGYSQSSSKTA